MKLLQDAEWSHWSDREIAKHAKVDHKTVGRFRDEIAPKNHTGEIPSMPDRTFTHHKTSAPAKMNTAAIGKRPATAASIQIVAPPSAPTSAPILKPAVVSHEFVRRLRPAQEL
jgi:hypothetical protein